MVVTLHYCWLVQTAAVVRLAVVWPQRANYNYPSTRWACELVVLVLARLGTFVAILQERLKRERKEL